MDHQSNTLKIWLHNMMLIINTHKFIIVLELQEMTHTQNSAKFAVTCGESSSVPAVRLKKRTQKSCSARHHGPSSLSTYSYICHRNRPQPRSPELLFCKKKRPHALSVSGYHCNVSIIKLVNIYGSYQQHQGMTIIHEIQSIIYCSQEHTIEKIE